MTEKEKDLLIKDLCCRLPYRVKVHAKYTDLGETIEVDGIVKMIDDNGTVGIEVIYDTSSAWTYVQIDNVKPYLFPMSSLNIFINKYKDDWDNILKLEIEDISQDYISTKGITANIEFFNKCHLDYRGLIDMGLVNDATELNIY